MRSSAARCSRAWMDPAMSKRHVVQQKACCAIYTLVAAIHMHVECLFKVWRAWNSSCLLDIKHSCDQGCAFAITLQMVCVSQAAHNHRGSCTN